MKTTIRKLMPIAISIAVLLAVATPANSATTDTFTVTVTGEYLWIDITNATWAIGTVAMSSITYTNETSITFIADIDNCTVNTDLKLQITSDASDWTASTTGNGPGADVYRLNNSNDIWGHENETLAGSATTISADITAGNNETFDMRFDAPTSTTTPAQQTITITATIAKH